VGRIVRGNSKGLRAVRNWLETQGRGPPIGAFVAQNDDMALGTYQALQEALTRWQLPLVGVPIIGCDGSPRFGQQLVPDEQITCTVVVASTSGPALDWLRRARSNAERPPSHVMLPVISFPAIDELVARPVEPCEATPRVSSPPLRP